MTATTDTIIKGEIFSFLLDNDLAELDQLHISVEKFGLLHDLGKKTIFKAKLVVEEIFTNIVSYAHADKNLHQVQFFLHCNENSLTICIEDDGIPFNLLEVEPLNLDCDFELRSTGGLGIHLIRQLMDDIAYKRVGSKNVVTLRKNFSNKEVE